MARDWKTTYSSAADAAQHTVTFPQAAIAGRTLVAIAAAPASIALPAGWTEHVNPIGLLGLSIASKAATAGETSLTWDRDSGQSTSPRALAGWVESRDDLSVLDGTPQGTITNTNTNPWIDLTVTTTVPNCRAYVAISRVSPGDPGPVTWPAPLVQENAFRVASPTEDPWLAVASAVFAGAGSYQLRIADLVPGSEYQVVAVVFRPVGPPPPAPVTAVEAENRLAGVAKATWDVTGAGDPSIQGFATAMSVNQGGTLSLKVHSPSSAWTGKVYRLGWYGGLGAREIATVSGPQTTQPSGTVDSTTGMASCATWTANGTWSVASAPAGVYIIKIWRTDNSALASHIGPFVVTDPGRKAAITVKLADATWQAYNHAGADPANPFTGKSIYGTGDAADFTFSQATRARAVSYDRPLVTRLNLPQTTLWNAEYPLIRWLERLGYDVDYLTCAQVDADPTLLQGRTAVISSGHDEYWSAGMHDAATAARDHGTAPSHLVFLSGNEAFWRIRWDGTRRTYACWKDSHDGQLNPTSQYSGTWQDTRAFNNDRRPPALLTGQRFRMNGVRQFPLVVPAAYAGSPLWRDTAVAALTGSQTWTSPGPIVGFEADEPADTSATEKPAGLVRFSQTVNTINGALADDNGNDYTLSGQFLHALTAYRNPTTGAVVFASGTVQYAWGLDDVHDRPSPAETPVLKQAFTNLLADLGALTPAYPFPSGLVMPVPRALTAYGFPAPADTTPPAAPTGLAGTPTQTSVALTWSDATDNVAVTGYRIYRNGVQVAEVGAVTSHTATGLAASTSYQWQVTALDAAGNESVPSATVTLATTTPEQAHGYATVGDLAEHLGRTPVNAAQLLVRASRDVDRALLCAVYDPDDPDVIDALREATLEQVAANLEYGNASGLGGSRRGGFTIGKLSVQAAATDEAPVKVGSLWEQAWTVLQGAGLTGHGPQSR